MGTTVSGAKRVHATDPLCTNNNDLSDTFARSDLLHHLKRSGLLPIHGGISTLIRLIS